MAETKKGFMSNVNGRFKNKKLLRIKNFNVQKYSKKKRLK